MTNNNNDNKNNNNNNKLNKNNNNNEMKIYFRIGYRKGGDLKGYVVTPPAIE